MMTVGDGGHEGDDRCARVPGGIQRIVSFHWIEAVNGSQGARPRDSAGAVRPGPRAAVGSRLPARTVLPKQTQQPELPDLMEAFWGDGARADPASGTRPGRDRRRPSSDPG